VATGARLVVPDRAGGGGSRLPVVQVLHEVAAERRTPCSTERIGAHPDGVDEISLAIELSELLRRTMLAYAPRNEVAGLTGESWLHWLDSGLDEKPFSEGPGHNVESLPYRRPDAIEDDVDVEGLIKAVKKRLQTPLAEAL
jgi:hypothetical protein